MSILTYPQLDNNVVYYTIHLLSDYEKEKVCDVFFSMRKNYFENNLKRQKDKVFLNVFGETVRYQYLMEKNKPLKWKKENEGKTTQTSVINGKFNYAIEVTDFAGAIQKKINLNNDHVIENVKYFDGLALEPYITIVPLITDKIATLALYKENDKKPQVLKCVVIPQDEKILKDLVLEISPQVVANTSKGISYFCDDESYKKWNEILKQYENDIDFNIKRDEKDERKKAKFIFNQDDLKKNINDIKFNIEKLATEFDENLKIENKKPIENSVKTDKKEDEKVEKKDKIEENQNVNKIEDQNGKKVYEGSFNGEKKNGFGVSYYKNGRVNYAGNFKDDKKDGFGISFRATDGSVQVGNFKDDKLNQTCARFEKSGKLISVDNFADDNKICSTIAIEDDDNICIYKNPDKKAIKNVTILSKTGTLIYSGEIKDNKKDGKGILFSEDGEIIYNGQFKNDEFCGDGVIYLENGETIEGQFKKNSVCLAGVKKDKSGKIIYKGDFLENEYSGIGSLYFEDGTYKTGEFEKGKCVGEFELYNKKNELIYKGILNKNIKDGKGILFENGKKVFDGTFLEDKKSGTGREFIDGKCVYMGEYENDYKHGFGTSYNENKPIYTGYFKSDKKDGKGILFIDETTLQVGEFENDLQNGRINIVQNDKIMSENIFENGSCVYSKKYSKDGNLIYNGNIKNGTKDGMGCTFEEYGDKIFEGIFKFDKPFKSMKIITREIKPLDSDEKLNGTPYKNYIAVVPFAIEIPYNNGLYSGQTDDKGLPCGKGTMLYSDHKYTGHFKNGKVINNGVIYYDNGEEQKVNISIEKNAKEIKFNDISYFINN